MQRIPEPLNVVLKDFCHVEWYEVDELAESITVGGVRFDVDAFKVQIAELLRSESMPIEEINALTGNEFESDDEVKAWLSEIHEKVFGRC